MNTPIVPVILCGGSGTRLWPLSREAFPKQFLRLSGKESMLQQTLQRLDGLPGLVTPLLVCNESARFIVAEQLHEIGMEHARLLLEPIRRNTAPAIASAALQAMENGDDPVLLVLPSDHVILDTHAFHHAIALARHAAEEGGLLTFGITPTGADTGYGYIRAEAAASGQVQRILEFVEKPALAQAEEYIASGDYFWNSGMFLFRASRYLEELKRFQPAVVTACRAAIAGAKSDLDFIRLDKDAYAASPDIAVDYAVMERTSHAATVTLDAGWNDIGSWKAVLDVAQKDADNNRANGDVLIQDCNDCLVHGTSRLVTAIGMRNTIIVETPDAVLVMDAAQAQQTKAMVAQLIARERPEAAMHREVFRPWGSYDSIGNGDRFQVKRITVKPGAKLSLQMHHHRAEHWIVVSGTAQITNGDKEYLLTENQSTYIPLGVVHSLANPGKLPLELIEIQSGSYLGEDDIVRFEDRYGRV
ncbi:mannose-1-phosphate guanylyltransferase/mannose-6-phosphate isomerase [Janthinobacterium violaceinigrum]|uniref:mannose-1-phosphate guanylyltransferase n=1 Tax=Janthinobacterium violaceinigrum TaxID=2654252 RepID=A0A6I1ID28_9BURK|nr:mannose-1-phosphate guanylyltransferase/mannose-6-phosphate isomerase [Janthinobacterium violaceinigrum]KAB8065327.1 mannose-1-phosphate guanylyltransferase/mannose-6-phosphate isomerase [Janthinobacterium violaceinigrum]